MIGQLAIYSRGSTPNIEKGKNLILNQHVTLLIILANLFENLI